MITCLADVLTPQELAHVRQALDQTTFVDGRATAGWHAREVKRNLQAQPGAATDALAALVQQALRRHPVFDLAVRPHRMRLPLFSRYQPGMTYGTHVDDAVMGTDPPLRADIALTVFLSAPDDYDGGELVTDTTAGEQRFKLPAGCAVVYPASTLHRVEPVTRGERLAAIGWVQSLVRDAAQRELLFDLDTARRSLFTREGKTAEFDLLSKSVANLLRMWVAL